jgi:hypothetical protein
MFTSCLPPKESKTLTTVENWARSFISLNVGVVATLPDAAVGTVGIVAGSIVAEEASRLPEIDTCVVITLD